MMKRIIALLLALILTVGLLPTVALAAEGETLTTDSGSVTKEARKDNLNLVKTVTKEGDNYKVTLESWATGTVTTTTETKPLDIVLLLDVSGSMDEKYSNETIEKFVPYDYRYINFLLGYETTNSDLNDYQDTRYGVWYKLPNSETYVSVKVEKEWKLFADDDYTYSYEQNGSTIIIEKTSNGNKPPKTQFYYKESANTTKLDALKTAVSAFIDNVATNSPNSNISIVKFAGDKYRDTEGNDTYNQSGYEYNYTQIVKKLTKVDTNGVTALKRAISALKAGGATASDYGLNKAQEALNGAKQERVVILFTDGEPNHSREFDKKVATDAVNKARELKTATTKTTIYTVGVFKNLYEDVNLYMSSVSSNYPNASAQYNNKGKTWKVSDGGSDFGKYYMNATSPVDLLKAFETISSEVSGGELGAEAVLTDVIAPNFALVAPEGTTGVTAYTVDKTADGWSTQKTTLTNGVTIGADGQVSVTGFDYSENCVTTTAKPNTTNDYGKKLVVEFTIHHNNYGGTQPTNAGASIKDEGNKDVITVDNPTVPVTISKPDDVFTQANEKTYNGSGFDILSEVATKANTLADGTNNAFVDIEVKITVEGTDYIYTISKGQQSGTWNQTASPKTSPNVKDEDKNGTPEAYEYPVTITFKDAAEGSNALNSTTATAKFKIKYAEATVKANNKSKKATEPDPDFDATVEGMVNGEDAAQKLTYTISRTDADNNTVGDHTTITPAGKPYQNNYKVTYETGTLTITEGDPTATEFSLTGKFQKTLNSNTADVPTAGKEFELSITGTAPTTNNTALTGNVTVAPTGSGTTFSDTKAFTFKSGTTGVTALTFTAPGEYKYEVKEVKPAAPVAGMQYDETIYTLTIEVTESNGALSITSAKVTKPGAADQSEQVADLMGTPNDTFTITNTFTAATLPLDPDPTTGTTAKVIKVLSDDSTATTEDMTFRASMTGGLGVARRVARATVKAGEKTADFSGFGTLVFTEETVYEYEIYEEATASDSIPGVRYDQTRYTLKVDVRENTTNHELYINSARYTAGQVEGNILTTPITFTNKYTKPEKATVVSKTVVTDLSTLSISMQNGIHEFESRKGTTILYPVANNGTNTLEVTKGTTTARLLYKISVDAGTQQSLQFDDANVDSYWYDGDKVAVSRAGSGFKVEFKNNVRTADIYVTVNHTLNFDKGKCTVENVISEEIKATTTVTEKDPDKCTIDFSTLIFKVLTKTGDRSFNGAEFTASVDGWKVNQYDVMSMRVIKTHFVDLQPVTLKATFPANTTFDADGKAYQGFTGDTLTVTAGRYLFLIDEINDGQTNITYDESKYWLNLGFVENAEGEVSLAGQRVRKFVDGDTYETVLALEDSEWMIVDTSISPVYFENTIDTGKDDYYPIIIPTIINKDTGMLNKTDHFAYVIGYPDGTVHPNGQITRAEVATIFFRLLRDEVRDGAFTTSNTYSDVAYGKWYNNPISTMSALGIITGYPDGTFKPNKPITRAEFAAIAARFDETQSGKSATFSDVIGHWAAKEIGIAYYNDWIKGYPDGTFKPDQNITRAEAMTLINRVLERKPESPADLLTNMNKWTDNMDTSKWYYLDVQEATNSHAYTRKTFNYELWRQMLNDPDWSRYER